MSVAPPSRAAPRLVSAEKPPAAPAAESRRSFADLLGTGRSGLEAHVSGRTEDERQFNGGFANGGHGAVRFDARPLVGPASVPEEAAGPIAPPVPPPAASAEDSLLGEASSRPDALTSWPLSSARAAATDVQGSAGQQPGGAHPVHQAGGPGGPLPAPRPTSSPDARSAAKPAPPRQPLRQPATSLPIATLAISPEEVLVTVRGTDLSQSDRDALLEQVRDHLASTHPERRSIRIAELPRKA